MSEFLFKILTFPPQISYLSKFSCDVNEKKINGSIINYRNTDFWEKTASWPYHKLTVFLRFIFQSDNGNIICQALFCKCFDYLVKNKCFYWCCFASGLFPWLIRKQHKVNVSEWGHFLHCCCLDALFSWRIFLKQAVCTEEWLVCLSALRAPSPGESPWMTACNWNAGLTDAIFIWSLEECLWAFPNKAQVEASPNLSTEHTFTRGK